MCGRLEGKGKNLFANKNTTQEWKWAHKKNRKEDVAITRLPLGHAGVLTYLNRFGQANSFLCPCGVELGRGC